VAVASSLVLVTLAAGCSSSGKSTTTVTAPSITSIRDLVVTSQDIQAAGGGSPRAVLLRWWQAVQLRHVQSAIDAYAKSVNTRKVPDEINRLAYFFVRSRPEIVEVKRMGATARALTVVDGAAFGKSDPNHVLVVTQTPTSFELKREDGTWKLANDDYLKQMFRELGLSQ
jgi:hypothetical protein